MDLCYQLCALNHGLYFSSIPSLYFFQLLNLQFLFFYWLTLLSVKYLFQHLNMFYHLYSPPEKNSEFQFIFHDEAIVSPPYHKKMCTLAEEYHFWSLHYCHYIQSIVHLCIECLCSDPH